MEEKDFCASCGRFSKGLKNILVGTFQFLMAKLDTLLTVHKDSDEDTIPHENQELLHAADDELEIAPGETGVFDDKGNKIIGVVEAKTDPIPNPVISPSLVTSENKEVTV